MRLAMIRRRGSYHFLRHEDGRSRVRDPRLKRSSKKACVTNLKVGGDSWHGCAAGAYPGDHCVSTDAVPDAAVDRKSLAGQVNATELAEAGAEPAYRPHPLAR